MGKDVWEEKQWADENWRQEQLEKRMMKTVLKKFDRKGKETMKREKKQKHDGWKSIDDGTRKQIWHIREGNAGKGGGKRALRRKKMEDENWGRNESGMIKEWGNTTEKKRWKLKKTRM